MRKLFAALSVAALIALPAFAQEFEFSGEIKTGVYWESVQKGDDKAKVTTVMHNNDDAGGGSGENRSQGRLRLNFHYKHDNMGLKLRFEKTAWDNNDSAQVSWKSFPYVYIYGNFLDEQIKVSAGRLSDSPWGMGGPEKWDTLEDELTKNIAVRTEIMPAFVPGLDIGFVLNGWNGGFSDTLSEKNIPGLLQESVLGVAYNHDYFGIRLAYRLDSMTDKSNTSSLPLPGSNEGEDLIYRVEERFLQNLLPGFQIWANGKYNYINCGEAFGLAYTNWLYVQYAPALFTAQFRFGYDGAESEGDKRDVIHARGSFYYNILSFLSAGASAYYAQDYGLKISPDSPFSAWHIEPKVKLTLGDSYIEFVYHYGNEYVQKDMEEKTHWANLRLVYTF
ncbi:MAG: hypothetical protein LBG05_10925 [Treponema sp.]|jgi:hypothetical protein|nr:hypothetical protein [Treponema sp.]